MRAIRVDYEVRLHDGKPAAGRRAAVYTRGTSTPVSLYADTAGAVALAQPLIVDSQGRVRFYYRPADNSAAQLDLAILSDAGVEESRQPIEPWTTDIGPWKTLPLLNGATSARGCRYCKTSDNMVILEVAVVLSAAGSPFANIPAGYRPARQRLAPAGSTASNLFLVTAVNGDLSIGFAATATPYFGHDYYLAEN